MMTRENISVTNICRELERITGGGRYRLRVGGGRVEIAQFRAPRGSLSVVYDSRGAPIRIDAKDLVRFATHRKISVDAASSDIRTFCEAAATQFRDLVIDDTSEYC